MQRRTSIKNLALHAFEHLLSNKLVDLALVQVEGFRFDSLRFVELKTKLLRKSFSQSNSLHDPFK